MRWDRRPAPRGMVYSLSLFLMLGALISLSLVWLSAADRRTQTLRTPSDMEVLSARLDEIQELTMDQMAINATLYSDGWMRGLNISDDGFPLSDHSGGRVDVDGLKAWLETDWSRQTGVNLSYTTVWAHKYGQMLVSTSGIVYTHYNDDANSDRASLVVPDPTDQTLSVAIDCQAPAGTGRVNYSESLPTGMDMRRRLVFSSYGAYNDNYESGVALIDSTQSMNFSARYYDTASPANWMMTLHADWNGSNKRFDIWSEPNTSYAGMSKAAVRCNWDESVYAEGTESLAKEEAVWIPAVVDASYGDANYTGYLYLARG